MDGNDVADAMRALLQTDLKIEGSLEGLGRVFCSLSHLRELDLVRPLLAPLLPS